MFKKKVTVPLLIAIGLLTIGGTASAAGLHMFNSANNSTTISNTIIATITPMDYPPSF